MGEKVVYTELFQQVIALYLIFDVVLLASMISENPLMTKMPILPAMLYSFIYVHNTIHI